MLPACSEMISRNPNDRIAQIAAIRRRRAERSIDLERTFCREGKLPVTSSICLAFHEKPRETCVLMSENSAFLGARPRAGPPRNISTSHGGVSTTFQSCQNLATGVVSAPIRLPSGECQLRRPNIGGIPAERRGTHESAEYAQSVGRWLDRSRNQRVLRDCECAGYRQECHFDVECAQAARSLFTGDPGRQDRIPLRADRNRSEDQSTNGKCVNRGSDAASS